MSTIVFFGRTNIVILLVKFKNCSVSDFENKQSLHMSDDEDTEGIRDAVPSDGSWKVALKEVRVDIPKYLAILASSNGDAFQTCSSIRRFLESEIKPPDLSTKLAQLNNTLIPYLFSLVSEYREISSRVLLGESDDTPNPVTWIRQKVRTMNNTWFRTELPKLNTQFFTPGTDRTDYDLGTSGSLLVLGARFLLSTMPSVETLFASQSKDTDLRTFMDRDVKDAIRYKNAVTDAVESPLEERIGGDESFTPNQLLKLMMHDVQSSLSVPYSPLARETNMLWMQRAEESTTDNPLLAPFLHLLDNQDHLLRTMSYTLIRLQTQTFLLQKDVSARGAHRQKTAAAKKRQNKGKHIYMGSCGSNSYFMFVVVACALVS
jgi:hypothetical protein